MDLQDGDSSGESSKINIPNSGGGEKSNGYMTYMTPQSRHTADSPDSFHTPEQQDYDYQDDINSEILDNSPPDHPQYRFSSDGCPHPMSRDDDIESKDSFDEGGYITATQLPPTRKFVDEDQPKLLLAEDPVQPIREKRPPADEYGATAQFPENEEHEELHGGDVPRRRSRRDQNNPSNDESSPLLPQDSPDGRDETTTNCCTICTIL